SGGNGIAPAGNLAGRENDGRLYFNLLVSVNRQIPARGGDVPVNLDRAGQDSILTVEVVIAVRRVLRIDGQGRPGRGCQAADEQGAVDVDIDDAAGVEREPRVRGVAGVLVVGTVGGGNHFVL